MEVRVLLAIRVCFPRFVFQVCGLDFEGFEPPPIPAEMQSASKATRCTLHRRGQSSTCKRPRTCMPPRVSKFEFSQEVSNNRAALCCCSSSYWYSRRGLWLSVESVGVCAGFRPPPTLIKHSRLPEHPNAHRLHSAQWPHSCAHTNSSHAHAAGSRLL